MRTITSFILLVVGTLLSAQELSVDLVVESDEVYVGEQFTVQIRVDGSSSPKEPTLAGVADFDVRALGGQTNNTELVSITNGKVTRSSTQGYVFTYQFSARRAGTLVIPPIAVEAGGKTLATQPQRIVVVKPSEAEDFRLVVEPGRTRAYVGEGVEIVVTWYITAPVRNAYFSVPFFSNEAFRFTVPEVQTTQGGRYSKALVNDGEAVVELGESTLGGTAYTTVRFSRIVTPLKAGTFALPQSSVQFEARVGRQRQRSLIDSFFDTSGGDYRPFVASAKPATLRVSALPTQGAPPRFAGHVGRYLLHASASPEEATVGDPITLTLTLSGPANVADAPAPDLAGQRIARDFVLHEGQPQAAPPSAAARVPEKAFNYTIRASRAGIAEIPAIELSYFDPQTSRYETARSAPVPVRIVKARVVTSRDAEGAAAATAETAVAPEDSAAEGGIAHNYEEGSALRPQYRALAGLVRRPAPLILLILSLAGLCASAGLTSGRRWLLERSRAGRDAFRRLCRHLEEIARPDSTDPAAALAAILSSLTAYFVRRLGLPRGAGTFADVSGALRSRAVPEAAILELGDVFRLCEAGRYAGYTLAAGTVREVSRRAMEACAVVEEHVASTGRAPRGRGPRALSVVALALALAGAAARPAFAQSTDLSAELFSRANAAFRSANEAAPRNAKTARELYAKSAELYERLILDERRESAALYYNLGNALYRLGDLGKAILAYRRAELLDPADANLRRNLTQARLDREDVIQSPTVAPLRRVLLFWHYDLSPDVRALLFALLFAAAAGLVCAWLFLRRPVLLHVAAAAALPALLFLGSLTADQVRLAARREGVIVAKEVVARRGDGEIYQPAFQRPLHAGTEFRLREERHGWYLIEIGDGRSCWIPARAAELLLANSARSPG